MRIELIWLFGCFVRWSAMYVGHLHIPLLKWGYKSEARRPRTINMSDREEDRLEQLFGPEYEVVLKRRE